LKKTSPSLDQPQSKKLHVASDISDDDFVWVSIENYVYSVIGWCAICCIYSVISFLRCLLHLFFSCFYNFLLLKNIGPSNVCTQKNKNDLQFGMEYSG
jgi:hypothetical protein